MANNRRRNFGTYATRQWHERIRVLTAVGVVLKIVAIFALFLPIPIWMMLLFALYVIGVPLVSVAILKKCDLTTKWQEQQILKTWQAQQFRAADPLAPMLAVIREHRFD
jgi:hypothetical protein